MLLLNLYQDRRSESDNYGKVYARVDNKKPIGLEALSKHMANHGSPYSEGVINGVLTDMVRCIRELMLDGQPVKLPNLCIFYASVKSGCANTAAGFDITKNIKGVKMHARATGSLAKKAITRADDVSMGYSDLSVAFREGTIDIGEYFTALRAQRTPNGSGANENENQNQNENGGGGNGGNTGGVTPGTGGDTGGDNGGDNGGGGNGGNDNHED